MSPNHRFLVTAALPYANGPIHLGHMAGAYLPADLYVRFQRQRGHDVAFLCGSDEHGVPITLTADKEGVTPQVIVDRYHTVNKAAFARFGMSFDNYSRTSLPLHHETSREFFLAFHTRGLLLEKREKQFFDETAGMFLPDRYVEGTCPVCGNPDARGDQCEKCGSYLNPMDLVSPRSKISGNPPVVRETSHWYFPLGKFQKRLEKYIAERNARDGWKDNVLQYCRGWFKEGLQDRAVTRDLDWGVRVPLPGYEQKVIYVWFDAVLGYISSTKEWGAREGDPDRWKRYWLEDGTKYVAFIGKDNVVFHCIVFPAMLMAWNDGGGPAYVLPENVPANEFLNFEGQKFSKSRGWGIDLQEFLDRYPADTLRYYLAVTLPEYRDTDFTWRDFQARTNNELADILGNFVNRTLAFTRRTFEGRVPPRGPTLPIDDAMLEVLENTPPAAAELFERYRFRDAVLHVMNLARAANKYFNDAEPWKTARTDRERCATTINLCLQVVRSLAVLMSPVTPFAAERIWQMLRLPGNASEQAWDTAGHPSLETNHALGTPHILFSKIEDTVIEGELKQLGVPPGEGPVQETGPVGAGPGPAKPPVSLEDFQKLDLRVAKVLACERVPKSEKLLKLQVEVGGERRQILAGIAKHYDADQLVGKSIVMLYNLQPAKLMGHESQGMLLAASDGGGSLVYITPAGEMPSGASIR